MLYNKVKNILSKFCDDWYISVNINKLKRISYDNVTTIYSVTTTQRMLLFTPGPVFMKGLRLSHVLGLNVVLKLRLLSLLSFVLNPYSQKGT